MKIEERDFIDLIQSYFRKRTENSEKIIKGIAEKYGYIIPNDKHVVLDKVFERRGYKPILGVNRKK